MEQAEQDYKKAISIMPNNSVILFNLGSLLLKSNRIKESLEYFQSAIQNDVKFAPAYNGVGLVFDKQENYEQALVYFEKAVELDGRNSVYLHN